MFAQSSLCIRPSDWLVSRASVVDNWPALNHYWSATLAQHWTGIWWVVLHPLYGVHRRQVLNECWPARRWWWKEYTSKLYLNLSPWIFRQLYPGSWMFMILAMTKTNTLICCLYHSNIVGKYWILWMLASTILQSSDIFVLSLPAMQWRDGQHRRWWWKEYK